MDGYCTWTEDRDGVWQTDCGQEFMFIDSWPHAESYMTFCCYCGLTMQAAHASSVRDTSGRIVAPPQSEPAPRPDGPWRENGK